MLALATREQRSLTGLEATQYQRHIAECDTCRVLQTETEEDWRWVARIPDDAFEDPNLLVLPVIDPIVFDSQREIASGGMGRITRANDRRLNREVAIKEVLHPQMRARFEREAMITARLQHPAIVPIYEAGMWPNGSAFYTMRLVKGGTLAESIAITTTMAERVALLPHVVAVTEALAYAHSRKIIHRDLKPGNVLVGSFGETVVIDWGLAKELEHSIDDVRQLPPSLVTSSPGLTHAGAVLGTPGFMSPEQASGAELDERADVYALGSILYNLLAGVAPYYDKHAGDSPDLVIELGRIKPPTPIAELAPDAPEDLRAIVERAMGPKDKRYPSAQEMAEELRRFQTGKLIAARDYRLRDLMARWIRKHRTAVVVGLVAFVALAAVAIVAVVNIARSRASEEAQRVVAETSLLTALEEQARTEMLVGDRQRGLVYASEAFRRGHDTPALRYLLAVATRDLDPLRDTIGPPELTTVCGPDPSCAGTDVYSMGYTPDNQLALIEATGRISMWRDGKRTSFTAIGSDISGGELDPAVRRAAIATDNSVELWDVARGTKLWHVDATLSTPKLVWAPTGKQLVALTDDDDVHSALVYDAETGATLATIEVGAQRVVAAAFSRDGGSLAACGADGTVRVWETAKFAVAKTWQGKLDPEALGFAGPDRLVIDAEIWRIRDAKHMHTLHGHHLGSFITMAATDSGDLIATADDRAVRLWDARGELLAESRAVRGRMEHLLFGSNGVLVGAGLDTQIYIWETPSLELRRAIEAHETSADLVALDRTGTRIATSGLSDQRVREWAMPVGSRIVHIPSNAATFASGDQWIEASAAGTTIRRQDTGAAVGLLELGTEHKPGHLEASRDGRRILLTEAESGSVIDLAKGPAVKVTSGFVTRLSNDGRFVFDASQVGANLATVVKVFDAASGRVALELKFSARKAPGGGDISPDGQRIALGFGNRIKLWQVATGLAVATVKVVGPRDDYEPRFDPTGKTFVVTASATKLAIVFDAATGAEIARFEDTAAILSVAFDREGNRLLTRNESHVVHLWDVRRRVVLASVHNAGNAFAFSASGDRFATGSDDGTVRLWDSSGRQLATFHDHHEAITQVSFNETGTRLLALSKDEHASLWDVHLEQRGPAEIAAIAERNSTWTYVGGLLVAKPQ